MKMYNKYIKDVSILFLKKLSNTQNEKETQNNKVSVDLRNSIF
jgi:hypothetical protein